MLNPHCNATFLVTDTDTVELGEHPESLCQHGRGQQNNYTRTDRERARQTTLQSAAARVIQTLIAQKKKVMEVTFSLFTNQPSEVHQLYFSGLQFVTIKAAGLFTFTLFLCILSSISIAPHLSFTDSDTEKCSSHTFPISLFPISLVLLGR